jgi:hypothetical protein
MADPYAKSAYGQHGCEVIDFGEPGGIRTRGPMLKRHMLYLLSYRPRWKTSFSVAKGWLWPVSVSRARIARAVTAEPDSSVHGLKPARLLVLNRPVSDQKTPQLTEYVIWHGLAASCR